MTPPRAHSPSGAKPATERACTALMRFRNLREHQGSGASSIMPRTRRAPTTSATRWDNVNSFEPDTLSCFRKIVTTRSLNSPPSAYRRSLCPRAAAGWPVRTGSRSRKTCSFEKRDAETVAISFAFPEEKPEVASHCSHTTPLPHVSQETLIQEEDGSPGYIRTSIPSLASRWSLKSKCPIWYRLSVLGSNFFFILRCTHTGTHDYGYTIGAEKLRSSL